jgi:hypothetical protein
MDRSNIFTAVVSIPVAFFVGALAARIFPDGMTLEPGNIAEWVTALAAVAAAGIAGKALRSWQDQMRGASRHAAAAEIAEAARLTKYHFYDARNPWFGAGEFPPAYRKLQKPTSPTDEARAWAYLFDNRYALLEAQIQKLATLRAKAGALLSDESAAALGDLARKARQLHGFFRDRVEQIKLGPEALDQLPDPSWVEQTNSSFKTKSPDDHSDKYSVEFEQKVSAVMDLVEAFL